MLRVELRPGTAHCFATLPLSLQLRPGPLLVSGEGGKHYLSYAGAKGEEGVLGLAVELAQGLGLKEEDWVTVAPVDLPLIPVLEVDPVDAESWDTIQANAEYFESAILTQISAVERNQVIPLWLNAAHCIKLKACEFGKAAGLLSSQSEVRVKPKVREGERKETKTLRNVVGSGPGLELKGGELGQVYLLAAGTELGVAVVSSTEFEEKHIKSPFFTDFISVEMSEIKLPGFNTPFALHKVTRSTHLLPTALIQITLPDLSLQRELIAGLEQASTAVVLTDGLKTEIAGVQIEVSISTEADLLACVYIDSKLPGFLALMDSFRFEYREKKKDFELFETRRKWEIVTNLTEQIVRYFKYGTPSGTFLLHGSAGVGKTSLISLLRKRLKTHLIAVLSINCADLTVAEDQHFSIIQQQVDLAKSMQPSILVLDGLEAIVRRVDLNAADGSAIEAVRTEHSVNFLLQILENLRAERAVKMLFTVRDLAIVPERMLETGICDIRVNIQPPDLEERLELLAALLPAGIATKETFAQATQSYLPIDLLNLVRNAKLQAALHPEVALQTHIQTLLPTFIPQALQSLPQIT